MTYLDKIKAKIPNIEDLRSSLPKNPKHAWGKRDVSKIKGVVFHQALGWSSVEDVAKYHTGPQSHLKAGGVHSISYTFAIRRNGSICLCNDLDQRVWSQGYAPRPGDENAEFMSVLFEGMFKAPGFEDPKAGEPTLEQLKSGIQLWESLRDIWGLDNSSLYGHYHFGKPACPGYTIQQLIETVRSDKQYTPITVDLSTPKSKQKALSLAGYDIVVDGLWGSKSKATLKKFQSDHGVSETAVWNSETEAKIVEVLSNLKRIRELL